MIDAPAISRYLRKSGYPDAEVLSLQLLGQTTQEGLKAYGYGKPLHIVFTSKGQKQELVLRTMAANPFGHERRADRADSMLLAFDTFNDIPRHIRPVDIGAVDGQGELIPMARGEVFLVTDYVEGELYAHDLHTVAQNNHVQERDLIRAEQLAFYLADLHQKPAPEASYIRSLRDTIGGSEGLFGQCDAYQNNDAVATPERLLALEQSATAWRWRLKKQAARSRRTHGDFHPFNILFRGDMDFSVLDCSRGGAGEPADDVVCLSVNYLFFSLSNYGELRENFIALWEKFWRSYLQRSGDSEIVQVVAPFFAWRVAVLVNPIWYPNLSAQVRERLLTAAERLLAGQTLKPERVSELFSA